jgi:hypothetical protein
LGIGSFGISALSKPGVADLGISLKENARDEEFAPTPEKILLPCPSGASKIKGATPSGYAEAALNT